MILFTTILHNSSISNVSRLLEWFPRVFRYIIGQFESVISNCIGLSPVFFSYNNIPFFSSPVDWLWQEWQGSDTCQELCLTQRMSPDGHLKYNATSQKCSIELTACGWGGRELICRLSWSLRREALTWWVILLEAAVSSCYTEVIKWWISYGHDMQYW